MTREALDCQMWVGRQRRTGTFTVHVDPNNIEACQELAEKLASQRGLPVQKAVMRLRVRGRWVEHRPA